MDALAVQMIDTSVVCVHQHGACIADNNGLPVHLAGAVPTGTLRAS
jgi:hypothetical protein